MVATTHVLKLSPITRLYAAFDLELGIDKDGKLLKLKDKYVERLNVAEQKRDSVVRSLVLLDAALAILISGKSLKIPYLDIATADLTAILEIVTALSSVSAVFAATAFINWAAYNTIINQYAIRDANSSNIDPDFIDAADKHTELTLKIFREKFNIWGIDFHEPGRWFKIFSRILSGMLGALFILFPILHYAITYNSFSITLSAKDVPYVSYIYISIVILCNILAAMILLGAYADFKFTVKLSRDPAKPGEDSA